MSLLGRWIRRTFPNTKPETNTPPTEPRRPRFRPALDECERRDATGNVLSGVLAAALGDPLFEPIDRMAALVGDWALLAAEPMATEPAGGPFVQMDGANKARPAPRPDGFDLVFVDSSRVVASMKISHPDTGSLPRAWDEPIPFGGNRAPLPFGVSRLESPVPRPAVPAADFGVRVGGSFVSIAAPAGAAGGPSFGTMTTAAWLTDPLPNEPPVANDDPDLSTPEDTAKPISVLDNDTDDDEDVLAIDAWQWDADHGTVTQDTDGVLTYTPFPDFTGTDTFWYTATDGVAVSDKAYVTVAVNPVNDEGQVFDDFRPFGLFLDYNTPADDRKGQFGSLFANDIDYDYMSSFGLKLAGLKADGATAFGSGVGAYALDFGVKGLVSVLVDGSGGWTQNGPNYYYGRLDIQYRVTDEKGWTSDWATATINGYWPEYPSTGEGETTVTAGADAIPVGDDDLIGSVTGNDSGQEFVVLNGHPSKGRLVSFDRAGGFEYEPSGFDTDAAFGYTAVKIWGPNYWEAVAANVTLAVLNMSIHDGQQDAIGIRSISEKEIGAVTVANRNDTDSDYIPDDKDAIVSKDVNHDGKTAYGVDEVDLMELRVYHPNLVL